MSSGEEVCLTFFVCYIFLKSYDKFRIVKGYDKFKEVFLYDCLFSL